MSRFIFDQLKKLDQYDSLANRGRRNRIGNTPKPLMRGTGPAPQTKRPLVGPGMWPPPDYDPFTDDSVDPGFDEGWDESGGDEWYQPPTPSLENIGLPMDQEAWMSQQPYGGQISPYTPQGSDYWQEQYQDYLRGWNAKFGTGRSGVGSGMGSNTGMRKPGSGGPRDMGTPSMGNLLRGKPNKSY